MSNYYEYREVKVMIARELMKLERWKVYDYHEDESDLMTDYFCPASWGGLAEKNGYLLCVDIHGEQQQQEIRKYNTSNFYDKSIEEKIQKLENMTVQRGASEGEEKTARASIEKLQKKAEQERENSNKYSVIGLKPGHMGNPPKCNWHIEKDGVVLAKGNGILKYNSISNYFEYPQYKETLELFKKDKSAYAKKYTQDLILNEYYKTEEEAKKCTESHIKTLEEDLKLVNKFNNFINKLDTTCGCLVGEGDIVEYEKIMVTEYKKELKIVETTEGSIKEGQLFILKNSFNYNCYKGLVYRIHETEHNGRKFYHAYKLNKKHNKECTGTASSNNKWCGFGENFMKWIKEGAISWCELQEIQVPYEVEKVVKKTIKTEKKIKSDNKEEIVKELQKNINQIEYEIEKSEHTKTHEVLWLVRIKNTLNKEEFAELKQIFATIKGYYSSFTHSFIFKDNPTEKIHKIMKEQEKDNK